ncbi:MAG: hypothetical protein ACKOWF_03035 [Chloroflexota bacterium]
MDQSSFDRVARLLGGAASRRAGLQAALGGLLGLGALDADAKGGKDNGKAKDKAKAKQRGKDRDRRPAPEGPCGNGSRKDNACLKASECCTGLCNTKRAKKNTDGKGRCRCIQRGRSCAEDRNCCNTLQCKDGVCGGKPPAPQPPTPENLPVPTSEPCRPSKDTCADPEASCTVYDSGSPAGTFCLIPFKGACQQSADCQNGSCSLGVCVTCSCSGCPTETCSPDVCATCTNTTVQAAITAASPGDIIRIAPGTYSEDLTIDKKLTLVGCPGGEVILRNATQDTRTITISDNVSPLELVDIVIEGNNDVANSIGGGGIVSFGDVTLCRFTVIRNCATNTSDSYGGGIHIDADTLSPLVPYGTLRVYDGSLIENNHSDSYGGGAAVDTYCGCYIDHDVIFQNNNAAVAGGALALNLKNPGSIRGRAQFLGNHADSYGGAILIQPGGMSISGNVVIRGNSADSYGGGISHMQCTATGEEGLVISGNVIIDGNTAQAHSGGIYGGEFCHLRIRDNVKITGNTASNSNGDAYGGGLHTSISGSSNYRPAYVLELSGNVEISGNTADSYGGGIAVSTGKVLITDNVVIANNTASSQGGGIDFDGGLINRNVQITGNSAFSGGGIYSDTYDLVITDNVVISGNTGGFGGAIYYWKGTPGNEISGNVRITGNTAEDSGSGSGGAIYLKSQVLTIRGSVEISGNTSDKYGGGISLKEQSSPAGLTVTGSATITGNTSVTGGGVWSHDASNTLTVSGSATITGNTPDNCAGGSISC